ncbi:hypothetical protein [Micromonospora lupini]|uniref:hypothetical protein n=1 Tax=Micromonospora lupini TaxID=285679 RepID=UPI0031D4C48F
MTRVVDARSYKSGDLVGLIALSGSVCYFPGCSQRIVLIVNGEPIVQAEIAHIRAAKANGPRYFKDMSDDERRSYANLIWLCVAHHKVVDRNRGADFSIETLERWKSERESPAMDALKGLGQLDENRLQELISEALETAQDKLSDALKRFEQVDSEAANLLANLVDEISSTGRLGAVPDPDVSAMLAEAASSLSHLPDYAPMLADAGEKLSYLPDVASQLSNAAASAAHLADVAIALDAASNKLQGLESLINQLNEAASSVSGASELVTQIRAAASSLATAANAMADARGAY